MVTAFGEKLGVGVSGKGWLNLSRDEDCETDRFRRGRFSSVLIC